MIRIHEQCGSKTKRVFCILSVLFILISLKFLIWSFTTVEFNIAPPKAFTSAMKGFSTMAPSTTITSLSTMAPSTTIASLSTMAPSTIITSLSTKAPSTIITSLSTMASSAIITSLSTMASSTIITSLSTMVPSTTITNSITTTSNQSTLPPPATISRNAHTLFEPTLRRSFYLSIHCNRGRLGNQMGTYATLLGLARWTDRIPLAKSCNFEALNTTFNLTTKVISEEDLKYFTEYRIFPYLRDCDRYIQDGDIYLTGYYHPISYTFFHHIRSEIVREFSFLPPFKNFAQELLRDYKLKRSNDIFIGIHVRRTDYIYLHLPFLHAREAGMEYYTKAMQYFRDKYKNILFVAVSDDRQWITEKFKFNDTVIPLNHQDGAYDLAILSECNHTIMSYGSFGFWGAYLAGGETVYFANYIYPKSIELKYMPYSKTYLPSWIGISTTNDDYWDTYTNLHEDTTVSTQFPKTTKDHP